MYPNPSKVLKDLDGKFLESLSFEQNLQIQEYRKNGIVPNKNFLNDVAYSLENFLSHYYKITEEALDLKNKDNLYINLYKCQRNFIVRRVVKKNIEIDNIDIKKITLELFGADFPVEEYIFANKVTKWLENEKKYHTELCSAEIYAKYMLKNHSNNSLLFSDIPKHDFNNLLHKPAISYREGFDLTDGGCFSDFAVKHSHYCLYCHHRNKDSCSKGLYKKDVLTKNPLGNLLSGCPLDQKISEMIEAKSKGYSIAALAITMIDNPIPAATGHRICNDCKKACIFQSQEAVEIPQIETKIFRDVLSLPNGENIYKLLTKWNPLKSYNYLPSESKNHNILIVGMGPAGFALSYYLLQEGCNVVGVDGNYKFGGVAEYGITARWDKKFLDIIYRTLKSYENFTFYPGIKFGSNITYEQAKELGFDQIALCTGAGSPKMLDIKNIDSKGIFMSADFLMKVNRFNDYGPIIPNNLIRMPIAVIGGGLTAIDAATESLAYYKVQIKELASEYNKFGQSFLDRYNNKEQIIIHEFLTHARELDETKDYFSLAKKWGGAKIYYHRNLENSSCYKINHEEMQYALNEGVEFIDQYEALEVIKDENNYATKIKFLDHNKGYEKTVDAKTILIAIGVNNTENKYADYEDVHVFGDSDPKFSGSVVKAIASAKKGYRKLLSPSSNKILKLEPLQPKLISRRFLASNIVEFIICAPLIVQNFKSGQFVKLQNSKGNFAALSVADVDINKKHLTLIMEVKGKNTKSLSKLDINDDILLIGPLGMPFDFKNKNNILLIGEDITNASLWNIASECKNQGYNVTHLSILNKLNPDVYNKKFSQYFIGTETILHCEFPEFIKKADFKKYDLVIISMNERDANIIKQKHSNVLVYTNRKMQCMMGGVCGSCIQKSGDKFLFTCVTQII